MKRFRMHMLVCGGTGCHAAGSREFKEELEKELVRREMAEDVAVVEVTLRSRCGCRWECVDPAVDAAAAP